MLMGAALFNNYERKWLEMVDSTGLSKQQERAVLALISAPTIKEASGIAKVSETTLYRWMNDDTFQGEYRAARRRVVQQALTQLQRVTGKAVQTLVDVMNNDETSSSSRVAAAKTILEMAVKAVEIEDLMERVESLERLLQEREMAV